MSTFDPYIGFIVRKSILNKNYLGFNYIKKKPALFSAGFWRRVRDLNPSYAINVNTISSRAPSTTQPTLHGLQRCVIHNVAYYSCSIEKCQGCFCNFLDFFFQARRSAILQHAESLYAASKNVLLSHIVHKRRKRLFLWMTNAQLLVFRKTHGKAAASVFQTQLLHG